MKGKFAKEKPGYQQRFGQKFACRDGQGLSEVAKKGL
jgi:hypothetical protein